MSAAPGRSRSRRGQLDTAPLHLLQERGLRCVRRRDGTIRSASPGPVYNDSNTFAYQGTTGGFTYKVGFTGKSDGLHATGDFCYQLVGSASGSSCGNGLSINVTLDGVFTWSTRI